MRLGSFIMGIIICSFTMAQDNTTRTGILVEFEFQLFNSKPGENRTANQDPGLMFSFLHPFNDHLAFGLGTGICSPYYTTSLMPVYGELIYWPIGNSGFHSKSRWGKVIPTNPDQFNGGSYLEIGIGLEIKTKTETVYTLGSGYSHQRMTSESNDIWWGNRMIDYRFNRVVLSLGMRF